MPRGDRRGSEGAGAMTGRGLGYCSGNNQPGFKSKAVSQEAGRGFRNGASRGSGFGCGQGRGSGMRYGRAARHGKETYHRPVAENETLDLNSPESRDREITRLENLANTLSSELEIVKNKIDKLKNN